MRPRRGTVGAVLALLITAGCSGETGEASPSPSPSASESATSPRASASESPSDPPRPTPPASAGKHTDKSAIDFAIYFVDVLNYTARSGNTDELDRITTSSCASCTNIREETERVYSADGYVRGGDWTIETQSIFQPDKGAKRRIVTFEVQASAQTYRPTADDPEQHFEPDTGSVDIYVRPAGDSWKVTRMDKTS